MNLVQARPSYVGPVPVAAPWNDVPGLMHGFFGRRGGVSSGAFSELNFSFHVGDPASNVRTNWQRVGDALPGDSEFVRVRQVHSDIVVVADELNGREPDADAIVTGSEGLALSILTADCVPILLVDPVTRTAAAVHAGWRGTVAGIVARTVARMVRSFRVDAANLRAALGPAIGDCCYEVSAEIADELEARWGTMPEAVQRRRNGDRPRLDLRAANAHLLRSLGVHEIKAGGPCTRCASAEYFSYRAATQPGGAGVTGRQLSYIGWRPGSAHRRGSVLC